MTRIEAIMKFGAMLPYQKESTTIAALKHFISDDAAAVYQLYLKESKNSQDPNVANKFRSILKVAESLNKNIKAAYEKITDAENDFVDAWRKREVITSPYCADESTLEVFGQSDLSDYSTFEQIQKFLTDRIGIEPSQMEYSKEDCDDSGYEEYLYVYGKAVHIVLQRSNGSQGSCHMYLSAIEGDEPIGCDYTLNFRKELAHHIGRFVQLHKPILGMSKNELDYAKVSG